MHVPSALSAAIVASLIVGGVVTIYFPQIRAPAANSGSTTKSPSEAITTPSTSSSSDSTSSTISTSSASLSVSSTPSTTSHTTAVSTATTTTTTQPAVSTRRTKETTTTSSLTSPTATTTTTSMASTSTTSMASTSTTSVPYTTTVGSTTTSVVTSASTYQATSTATSSTSSTILVTSTTTTSSMSASSTSTTTSGSGAQAIYVFAVACSGANPCMYSASISWTSGCTDGCYASFVGVWTGNVSYSFNLPACGEKLIWGFSPIDQTVNLLITVTAPDGSLAYSETATLIHGELNGSYTTCSSPVTTTTTVGVSTSTTSTTTNTYHFPVVASLTYLIANKTACGYNGITCIYQFQWDVVDPVGCYVLCIDGAATTNQTATVDFPSCTYKMVWTFTMNTPTSMAKMIFEIQAQQGGSVLYQQSTDSVDSTTISGSWSPPCSAAPATGSSTTTATTSRTGNGFEAATTVAIAPELLGVGFLMFKRRESHEPQRE